MLFKAVKADVLTVATALPNHNEAEAETKAAIALLAMVEAGALVRAVPADCTTGTFSLSHQNLNPQLQHRNSQKHPD